MTFLDGLSVGPAGFSRPAGAHHRRQSSRSRHKKRSSRSRSRSRSNSRRRGASSLAGSLLAGLGESTHHHHKHNASRSSFFSLGNWSRSSLFGGRSSYYKRSPRQGFMQRAYKRLKHLLRDLVRHARRNPLKVFFLVIMPLLTGGALTALLARFGLRMPPALERMLGVASQAASRGGGVGLVGDAVRMAGGLGATRRRDGKMQWERKPASRHRRAADDADGWSEGIMGVAKMFI
ncbi:hypothetical protein DCS_05235 [Drechmeria coniospora]|uniref:Uncharacterized protein n=1 Tax=Drechmeria coniospora TaxID=98403 RepID=A0A151GMK2_DRECN|nr:hypothetical protein DCS_05235 [Drechmeria coniospora]KYK58222.1 hypothetical protein DCS_05235 [Drechmeria coniospora]